MRRRHVLIAVGVAAVATSTAEIASAGDQPTARASATTVNVSGKEFSFTLNPTSAKAGSVTFKFTNKGKVKHDFKIAGKATSVLTPGKAQSITVKLKKGTYSYLCTVKGHAAAGMKGKFRVR